MTAMVKRLTFTALPDLPMVEPGDDLCSIIVDGVRRARLKARAGDIFVVAQKIVSKSEDRYVELGSVTPGARAMELAQATGKDARLVEVILSESIDVVRMRGPLIIMEHRLGFVMANAGVDESNVESKGADRRVLLLPRDPDASAARLKDRLDAALERPVGVIINDSFGRPWRNGVTGVALGAAGVPSLESMIGRPDLFGRAMRVTEVATADELAAGASAVMGQSDEGLPVVHVRGCAFRAAPRPARDLIRARAMDLFR